MRAFILASFMLVSGTAWAQGASIDKVKSCTAVKEDAARLQCFDAAVAALQPSAPEARKIVKAPEPAATSTASLVPKKTETPDRITVSVTAISPGADGKLRFALSNGETWRQTDSIAPKNLGKGPWEAELRKAALGSYMLKIGNKTPVRVALVQ
ncbi:MAG TPA: hypothetical protein VGO52_22205 [Hyphomonadaceae bacterium]|jgi:hypothetical protein|nr:hypothetical protein [Hyphomonadaceae bacterium]